MEDFRKRISSLVAEGSSIVQSVESTSFIINLSKVVLPYVFQEEDLESLEDFVETLNLPSPVHQVYIRYIQWNRDCEAFFSDYRLTKSSQFKEFVELRKKASQEILKESPYQRAILLRIQEQLSLIDNLSKLNLESVKAKQKGVGFVRLRTKLLFTVVYIAACAIVDYFSYYAVGLVVIGIIGVEAAILMGIPKLLEWLGSSSGNS
jgi:hypothetical protein